jgi:RNA polymerase-binding transcription factor DksA
MVKANTKKKSVGAKRVQAGKSASAGARPKGGKKADARAVAKKKTVVLKGSKPGAGKAKTKKPAVEALKSRAKAKTPVKKTPALKKPVKPISQKKSPAAKKTGKAAPKKSAPQKKPLVKAKAAGHKPPAGSNKPVKAKVEVKKSPPQKVVMEPTQPTGMYNGILLTREIKPFPVKTPYSKSEVVKLRDALLGERQVLLDHLATLSGASLEAMVGAKEHAGYSIHIAEHASDLQTAEANLGVRSIEEERLAEVEAALERIKNDVNHYGLCMACGSKIGIQRLIARPHAHLCMPCRQTYETIRSRRGY